MNHHKFNLQVIALVAVSALLVLTALGNAAAMFWASIIAMAVLFIWFLADRNLWLAAISAIVFTATIVATSTSLF